MSGSDVDGNIEPVYQSVNRGDDGTYPGQRSRARQCGPFNHSFAQLRQCTLPSTMQVCVCNKDQPQQPRNML
jgi:hypothetical protein